MRTTAKLSSKYRVHTLKSSDNLDVDFLHRAKAPSSALLVLSGTRIIKKAVLDYFDGDVINVPKGLPPAVPYSSS